MLIPMLIKLIVTLWIQIFFMLLAIYSETVVQKCSKELCKNHKKTIVMKFFLKCCSLQLSEEKTSLKVFSREICKIFQNSSFLEQFLVNASVSGALAKQ